MKKRFIDRPIVRRVGAWLLMMIVTAVIRRLTGQKTTKNGRKYIKNRSK